MRIPKDSIGAELGVWKGDSSKLFLKRAKLLYLVDSWSIAPYSESDEHGNYEAYIQRYKKIVGSQDPKDFQKYYDKIYEGVVKPGVNKAVKQFVKETGLKFDNFYNNQFQIDVI